MKTRKIVVIFAFIVSIIGLTGILLTENPEKSHETHRKNIFSKEGFEKTSIGDMLPDMYFKKNLDSDMRKQILQNILLFENLINENPADISRYLGPGVLCSFIEQPSCSRHFLSIVDESGADDWISHFVRSFYHYQKWEDEKAIFHLKQAKSKYLENNPTEDTGKLVTFTKKILKYLEKRIDGDPFIQKKIPVSNIEDCFFKEINPEKGVTAKWSGICKNGWAHGKCILKYSDGDIFHVNMKNGLMEGPAELMWSDGEKYIGMLKDGLFHGYGSWSKDGKTIYKGNYKNGLFHGKGEHRGNNIMYSGIFKNNIPTYDGRAFCLRENDRKYITRFEIIRHYPVKRDLYTIKAYCNSRKRKLIQEEGSEFYEKQNSKLLKQYFSNLEEHKKDALRSLSGKKITNRKKQLDKNKRIVETMWYFCEILRRNTAVDINETMQNLLKKKKRKAM